MLHLPSHPYRFSWVAPPAPVPRNRLRTRHHMVLGVVAHSPVVGIRIAVDHHMGVDHIGADHRLAVHHIRQRHKQAAEAGIDSHCYNRLGCYCPAYLRACPRSHASAPAVGVPVAKIQMVAVMRA